LVIVRAATAGAWIVWLKSKTTQQMSRPISQKKKKNENCEPRGHFIECSGLYYSEI
jgi:hypothetical protein